MRRLKCHFCDRRLGSKSARTQHEQREHAVRVHAPVALRLALKEPTPELRAIRETPRGAALEVDRDEFPRPERGVTRATEDRDITPITTALNRLAGNLDRLSNLNAGFTTELDRLNGSVPEADGEGRDKVGSPGQINQLHRLLDVLDEQVGRLDSAHRRLAAT